MCRSTSSRCAPYWHLLVTTCHSPAQASLSPGLQPPPARMKCDPVCARRAQPPCPSPHPSAWCLAWHRTRSPTPKASGRALGSSPPSQMQVGAGRHVGRRLQLGLQRSRHVCSQSYTLAPILLAAPCVQARLGGLPRSQLGSQGAWCDLYGGRTALRGRTRAARAQTPH